MSARYLGLWYGGSSYAAPDGYNPAHQEYFDSIWQASRALQDRAENHNGYTPCVDGESCEMHLYRGGTYHENGPDLVLTIGPRGGVRQERN
jgi:hypothetical protein